MTSDDDRPREDRDHDRVDVLLAAELVVGARRAAISVRNLSRRGIMGECPFQLTVGDMGNVLRGRLSLWGRVIWVRGHRFGLAFEAPIEPSEFEQAG